MNLPMNLNDIDLWEKELLKGFALPLGFLPEVGEVVNILEPFKRLTILEPITEKKVTMGIMYRSDGLYVWDDSKTVPNKYDEAPRWSPASQLPEYAIRRKAIVTKFECKPLRSFTDDDIKLLLLAMLHKIIPSFLWRNICPSRTLSCCMAGGSSTIKRL